MTRSIELPSEVSTNFTIAASEIEESLIQTEVYIPNWGWLPPVARIYRSMFATLSQQGRTRLLTQTQLEYAQSIGTTEHPQIAKVVWEISQLYTAWRYGKQPIDVRQLAKKLQHFQHLQQLAATRRRQQWFASLNLTSRNFY